MGEQEARYGFEQAEEEAARMVARVKSGKAEDYSEAELQLEHEKRELAPVLVPVEQLIPGIKAVERPQLSDGHNWEEGSSWDDSFTESMPRAINNAFYWHPAIHPEEYPDPSWGQALSGQVVVDIGAGLTHSAYFAAIHGRAKGYVAVDKFHDLTNRYDNVEQLLEEANEQIDMQNKKLIPVAVVKEDMLTFLKRLPDNSVSIISSGIGIDIIPNPYYREEIGQEMLRVLSSEGFIIASEFNSLIPIGVEQACEEQDGFLFLRKNKNY